jgi:Fungalysin metallopeptidase (M36)
MRDARAALAIAAVVAAAMIIAPAASARSPALKDAEAPVGQLERSDANRLPGGAVAARYDQEVAGVPVVNAGIVVLEGPGTRAELVADKSVAGLEAPGAPTVPRRAAAAAALDAIGSPAGGDTVARLVIDAAAGNQLAWEVTHSDADPISDWLVTVSAATGEVIARNDLLRQETADARLFVPNPVVSANGYKGFKDRGDRDSKNLTNERIAVTMQDLADGQSCLKGRWAAVKLGAKGKRVCKDSLDWSNVRRAGNRFEALMAYHHITETQHYIQSLGLTEGVNDERQNVIANSIPDDNSFYLPSRDEIQLGTGGVDDGEDADVIVHEYGHAVQDAQAPGAFRAGGNAAGAMGEGFGDYLAAAYSTEVAGPDDEWTPCIMEWDATSYDDESAPPDGICLRRADDDDDRLSQLAECGTPSDIHCMGQVWSSALLDLRTELGDDVGGDNIADKLSLAAHFLLPNNPTYEDAVAAILGADDAIYTGGHCTELADEFQDRGYGTFNC